MNILQDTQLKRNEIRRYITYAIISIVLIIIDLTVLDFVAIGNITPDLILILCVWISIYEGQFIGVFAAFFIGLALDIVSIDVIGTNALTKILVSFVAGFFYKEGEAFKTIGSYKFLLIVFGTAVLHNLLYYFFYLKMSEASYLTFFLKYGIATALYTTVLGIFPMLSKIPRKGY